MNAELPVRGFDAHGSGAFGAPRGNNTHRGVDLACYKGTRIKAECAGRVTKIGYPYDPADPKKGHLRYVQVTDSAGLDHRYFYISPLVIVGDPINFGDVIGVSQGLLRIYPGITDHIHYEIKSGNNYLDPTPT